MKKYLVFIGIILTILVVGCSDSETMKENEVISNENESLKIELNEIQIDKDTIENLDLLTKLEKHTGRIWALDANEQDLFASGSKDGNIFLWDYNTKEVLQSNVSHNKRIEELYLIDDKVLSIADDHKLIQMDLGKDKTSVLFEGKTTELAISRDGKYVGISDNNYFTIYEYEGFVQIGKYKLEDGCFDIRFGLDGKSIYYASHNGSVKKVDWESGETLKSYEGITLDVHALELTSDEKYLVAGSTDRSVVVWDTSTGEVVSKYYHSDGVNDVDISEDGKIIVSVGADRNLIIASLETGEILKKVIHPDELLAVTINPERKYIVTGGYDNVLYVWGIEVFNHIELPQINRQNANQIEELLDFKGHQYSIFDIAISSDSKKIASAERNFSADAEWISKVNIWNISTQEVLQSFHLDQAPVDLEFAKNDKLLVCKGEEGELKIWNIEQQEFIFNSFDYNVEAFSVGISRDYSMMVTGGRHGEIVLWNFEDFSIIKQGQFDDEFIMQTVFSPDQTKIGFAYAGGTEDFSTHVLDASSLEELFVTVGHEGYNYTIDFSNDSSTFTTSSADKLIKLWNAESGELITTFQGHTGKVMDSDFSLYDDVLISGSAHDFTMRIWDVVSQQFIKKVNIGEEVQAVEVSPDGKFIVIGGENGLLKIFGVTAN